MWLAASVGWDRSSRSIQPAKRASTNVRQRIHPRTSGSRQVTRVALHYRTEKSHRKRPHAIFLTALAYLFKFVDIALTNRDPRLNLEKMFRSVFGHLAPLRDPSP
ncbi:hypothetical protein XAC3810_450066 [Xanthomonas citri pv. citri]|uniref:Uncharacterized protein n=1 Tax=Xanthomonas citri pv. citri TaxID=611301 RepID=A0A0U5FF31_XANCI|nr:hypothetical protein XAC9322_460063 [Xanthomonas citri pv. citri]CEE30774.1 hypothetical protein XAC1083_450063 [Xanthomonas citri pv. citri]CEE40026.1 hypothetical protein XAC3810_450066 [Xanthomonas citri pv. citri]CEE67131.1 hypothetical protein XACW160_460064 [Xanthomonas citri pv. citri]CEE71279.1 hypothetical protein XAC2852_470191 [Xanthomonas citri pv. citri]